MRSANSARDPRGSRLGSATIKLSVGLGNFFQSSSVRARRMSYYSTSAGTLRFLVFRAPNVNCRPHNTATRMMGLSSSSTRELRVSRVGSVQFSNTITMNVQFILSLYSMFNYQTIFSTRTYHVQKTMTLTIDMFVYNWHCRMTLHCRRYYIDIRTSDLTSDVIEDDLITMTPEIDPKVFSRVLTPLNQI